MQARRAHAMNARVRRSPMTDIAKATVRANETPLNVFLLLILATFIVAAIAAGCAPARASQAQAQSQSQTESRPAAAATTAGNGAGATAAAAVDTAAVA